jgi:hypothetical protein
MSHALRQIATPWPHASHSEAEYHTPKGGNFGCSVEGCDSKFYCHGYCQKHYVRWVRHGDPLYNKHESHMRALAKLLQHKDKKACVFWPWPCGSGRRDQANRRYAQITIDGEQRYVHVVVCELFRGPRPTLLHEAAHSCGNGHKSCVNPHHLRWATRTETMANMMRRQTGSNQFGCYASFPQYCSVEDCSRKHYALGLCNKHWQRMRKAPPIRQSV